MEKTKKIKNLKGMIFLSGFFILASAAFMAYLIFEKHPATSIGVAGLICLSFGVNIFIGLKKIKNLKQQ